MLFLDLRIFSEAKIMATVSYDQTGTAVDRMKIMSLYRQKHDLMNYSWVSQNIRPCVG